MGGKGVRGKDLLLLGGVAVAGFALMSILGKAEDGITGKIQLAIPGLGGLIPDIDFSGLLGGLGEGLGRFGEAFGEGLGAFQLPDIGSIFQFPGLGDIIPDIGDPLGDLKGAIHGLIEQGQEGVENIITAGQEGLAPAATGLLAGGIGFGTLSLGLTAAGISTPAGLGAAGLAALFTGAYHLGTWTGTQPTGAAGREMLFRVPILGPAVADSLSFLSGGLSNFGRMAVGLEPKNFPLYSQARFAGGFPSLSAIRPLLAPIQPAGPVSILPVGPVSILGRPPVSEAVAPPRGGGGGWGGIATSRFFTGERVSFLPGTQYKIGPEVSYL